MRSSRNSGSAVICATNSLIDWKMRSSRNFINAWEKKGKETKDGKPYLTRSALQDYLCEFMELTPSTAKTYVKPGRPDTLIYNLLQANIIEPYHQHGWVVVEEGAASSMLLSAA